jgi:hypothetical protein
MGFGIGLFGTPLARVPVMAHPDHVQRESLGSLVRGILYDLRTLIREEIALARVELREQAGRARTAAVSFAIAFGALIFGGSFLLVALAMAIADLLAWPLWAGFLAVAVALSAIGVFTFSAGRSNLRKVHVPPETLSTLKENSEWIAKRLSSARK